MRFVRAVVVTVLVACAFPSLATATFFDGNKLYDECEMETDRCYGFLMALADVSQKSYSLVPPQGTSCIPPETQARQILDVVMNYLKDRPQERTYSAASTALVAIAKAWPCPKQ